MRRYVALEAAPGLVVMNDKILEIERLAELRRLADGGVDHGGALCVGYSCAMIFLATALIICSSISRPSFLRNKSSCG